MSSRMGRDKRQLEYPPFNSLFHRQLSLLENCFPRVWVSVQTSLPFSIPHRIVVDLPEAKGPMAGLLSALHEHPSDPIFVLAVDMPGIHEAAIAHLCAVAGSGVDRVVPWSEGRVEPLCGIYFPSSLLVLRQMAAVGRYGLQNAPLRERLIPKERLEAVGGLSPFGLRSLNHPRDVEEFRTSEGHVLAPEEKSG